MQFIEGLGEVLVGPLAGLAALACVIALVYVLGDIAVVWQVTSRIKVVALQLSYLFGVLVLTLTFIGFLLNASLQIALPPVQVGVIVGSIVLGILSNQQARAVLDAVEPPHPMANPITGGASGEES